MTRSFAVTSVVATTAVAALLTAGPALSADDPLFARGGADAITASGTCADDTMWTLSGKSRGLRVLVRLELQGEPKQRWRIRFTHNDLQLKRDRVKKTRRDGTLRLRRPARNRPGTDLFAFRATNRSTDQECQGQLSY